MSPTMTVVLLAVLWLIVVVPMIVQRTDDGTRSRSPHGLGAGMRSLARRLAAAQVSRRPAAQPVVAGPDSSTEVMARVADPHGEVPGASPKRRHPDLAPANRQRLTATEEAQMHRVDRTEMSDARRAMMARRRRSLTVLSLGSVVTVLLGVVTGGIVWVVAALFVAGLAGYLLFLRRQAVRDRERRAARELRSMARRSREHEASEVARLSRPMPEPESAVRIDDDDIELHMLDTVDLTGVYDENYEMAPAQRRRAG